MKIYILSLKKDQARREVLIKRGFPIEFVEGYFEGTMMTDNEFKKFNTDKLVNKYKRNIKKGEIGCLLSHKLIYTDMVRGGVTSALIIEDDVIINKNYSIECILNSSFFDDISHTKTVALLGNRNYERKFEIVNKVKSKFLNETPYKSNILTGNLWGTYAYAITLAGAKSILTNEDGACLLADDWRERKKNNTLNNVLIIKNIFCHDDEALSNIKRTDKEEIIKINLIKSVVLKLVEKISKKITLKIV